MHTKSYLFKKKCISAFDRLSIWKVLLGIILAFIFIAALISLTGAINDRGGGFK